MINVLTIMNNELKGFEIPYTFDEWDKELELPQFIGEIEETPTLDEDGKSEYLFILTGYAIKTNYDYLLEVAEKLKKKYKPSYIVNGIVIAYENLMPIDNDTDDLKQIQINLRIKEWSI